MKKSLFLIACSLVMTYTGLAQSFTNGNTHFQIQYDPNETNPSCLNNFTNTGGIAFAGGNVEDYGYSTNGISMDAVYILGMEGSIDPEVSPALYHIYYTNEACEPMVKSGNIIGIDLTSGKIKVVAKAASSSTVVEFFIANGEDVNWPGATVGSGSWETFSYSVGAEPAVELSLTTEYQEYSLDLSTIEAFNNWSGKTKINYWGIRFTEGNGDEVWIKSIEFGEASTTGVKKVGASTLMNFFPNPSNGHVKITTSGKTGDIIISNANGLVVKTVEANQPQDYYDVEFINKGVYIVSFISDEFKVVKKLVIE